MENQHARGESLAPKSTCPSLIERNSKANGANPVLHLSRLLIHAAAR
jgi:hypothetical protein